MLEQWKGELEDRFGLVFESLDRAYLSRMRRERGFGVNPWRTHSRFLVSHNLLIDPSYADTLREWLGPMLPGSLLILDEAHHAAPASGGRYGIETKFTRAIRDLAGRFEHRLFLSATPHNGHSNSFSTLLELLDPYRFTRGVKVRGKGALDDVMVRRLKEDIREVRGGFPKRNVEPVVIEDLPPDAPELLLASLLDEYRTTRGAGTRTPRIRRERLPDCSSSGFSSDCCRRLKRLRAASTCTGRRSNASGRRRAGMMERNAPDRRNSTKVTPRSSCRRRMPTTNAVSGRTRRAKRRRAGRSRPSPLPPRRTPRAPPKRPSGRTSSSFWIECKRLPRHPGTCRTPRPAGSSTGSESNSAPGSRPSGRGRRATLRNGICVAP